MAYYKKAGKLEKIKRDVTKKKNETVLNIKFMTCGLIGGVIGYFLCYFKLVTI